MACFACRAAPKSGSAFIPALQTESKFRIREADNTDGTRSKNEAGKTVVTWKHEAANLKEWLTQNVVLVQKNLPTNESSKVTPTMIPECDGAEKAYEETSADKLDMSVPPERNHDKHVRRVSLAYTAGETVEYYSRRNRTWKPGQICAVFEGEGLTKDGQIPSETYQVQVHGQLRDNVPLSLLRRPFVEGDPVEIVCKSDKGDCMSSRGVINGPQSKSPGVVGYRVQLENGCRVRISSGMVRGRFSASDKVQVYAGGVYGWVNALIDSKISSDGLGLEPWEYSEDSTLPTARSIDDSTLVVETRGINSGPVWVPLRTIEADSMVGPLLRVPSFLIRHREVAVRRGEISV